MMAPKLLHMLLFLAVASTRTIDIRISSPDIAVPSSGELEECELRVSASCNAECASGEEECYSGKCGPGGCCVEGSREELCCKNSCLNGSDLKAKKQQDIIIPAPKDNGCHWEGTAPSCVTGCSRGKLCGVDACGNGACCWTGWKTWCCDSCPNSLPLPPLAQTPLKDQL